MKLYRISAPNGAAALKPHWFTSKGAAASFRADTVASGVFKRKDLQTDVVEVPTKKDALVEWLTERGV